MQSLNLSIAGMTCVNCANIVKKSLTDIPGIQKVDINIVQNKAHIVFDETKIDEDTIIARINTTSYRAYRQRSDGYEVQEWKFRSIVWIILSIPLILLMGIDFLGIHGNILMTYWVLISFCIATIVQIVIGKVFYQWAYSALRLRSTNMFTLIATGSWITYFFSLWNMGKSYMDTGSFAWLSMEGIFFEVGVFLVVFISIGKYLESIAKLHSSKSIKNLETLRPQTAFVQEGKKYIQKDVNLVHIGDTVRVKALEAIPFDGEIVQYESTIDESTLTGESIPILKKVGDTVYAGTINMTDTILIRVKKVGSHTLLGQIIQSVESAYTQKSDIENFADRIARVLIPVILSLSFLTFFVWFFRLNVPMETAILYACSVVVIACPCALWLATPTAVTVGISWATSQGILVKWGVFLEKVSSIRNIFFDKTGTLTTGKFQIWDIRSAHDYMVFMPIVCSLQSHSNHPIATAFSLYAQKHQISFQEIENVKILHSEGISGEYKKDHYMVGNKKALQKYGFSSPDFDYDIDDNDLHIYIGKNNVIIAQISLVDTPRAGGKELISYLIKQKINVFLLTGDKDTVARKLAQTIWIPQQNIYSEVLPQQKAEIVKKYPHSAMFGDGVNDSVAFTHASVGISMGKGNDIALSTSDVIVLRNSLDDIRKLHIIAKATKWKIHQNLFFSLIYNISGIPIAAGLFAAQWLTITPQFAGLAMILSSVWVLTNTLTLKMGSWISWGMFVFLVGFFSIFFGIFIF